MLMIWKVSRITSSVFLISMKRKYICANEAPKGLQKIIMKRFKLKLNKSLTSSEMKAYTLQWNFCKNPKSGYSVSKRLVKLTRFQCFPCSCLDIKIYLRYHLHCAIILIHWLGTYQCKISWKLHLNISNTDSMMQNIKKFAAHSH